MRPSGITSSDLATVTAINHRQRHRGPDAEVGWNAGGAALGHTRLAIVDLTDGGRQPFMSGNGSVAVAFNGEIYNHDALRRRHRLAAEGRCDGAILPELWERLGSRMFTELRGMYAIAVCDLRAGTVTLARDPFGIKPLYWSAVGGAVAFASEPRSLLRVLPRVRLNGAAVRHYLMFGAMGRDQSPYRDIESVPAGSWLQWDRDMNRTHGLTHPSLLQALAPAASPRLRSDFLESVSLHLRSDVPVALLLSAGLDSAAIAWAAGQVGAPLTCVTVDMGSGTSEQAGAERVAARFGHRHEVVSTSPDVALVERFFAAMQRPSIDGLNMFLASRAIASLGVKVALSGLGGDELLAGYPAFRALRYLSLLRRLDAMSLTPLLATIYRGGNRKLTDLLTNAGPRDAAGLAALARRVLTEDEAAALSPPPADRKPSSVSDCGRDTSAQALSRAELDGYLGGTLLPDTDTYSMACSVEMRVPYLDAQFARTALAVAPRRGVGKRRFAAALGDRTLRGIARQPKRGFTLPMDRWMRQGPLAPWVHQTSSTTAPVRHLLRADAVDQLLAAWREGQLSWSRAWLLVSLDAWLRNLDGGVASRELTLPEPIRVEGSGHCA